MEHMKWATLDRWVCTHTHPQCSHITIFSALFLNNEIEVWYLFQRNSVDRRKRGEEERRNGR